MQISWDEDYEPQALVCAVFNKSLDLCGPVCSPE